MINNIIEFRKEIEKINEWWFINKVKEIEKYSCRRAGFSEIKEELNTKRIITLLGARRTGKSVLLKQIINYLIEKSVNPLSILYYSLDDPTLFTYSDNLIKDMIDYYLENIAKGERHYIFLDEIHSFKNWHRWIKSYYDRYPNLKFILSGSSSLSLQKEANVYLRGRNIEIELYPLNFNEFLEFSNINLGKIKYNHIFIDKLWHKVKNYFNEYLLVGGFPEWFEIKKEKSAVNKWFLRLISDIPKKAIYEDIVNYYGIKNPKIAELIFTFISVNQSRILAYETINEVANLDRATLVNYIEFLKSSYLIVEILKFARVKEQIKAKKKYLLIDQGLRNAILRNYQVKEDNVGFIVENIIGLYCFIQSKKEYGNTFYWKITDEIDFVVKNKIILPVEVKYKTQIKKSDLKSLIVFLKEKNLKRGVIITKDIYKKETIDNKNILYMPAWLFLCSDIQKI